MRPTFSLPSALVWERSSGIRRLSRSSIRPCVDAIFYEIDQREIVVYGVSMEPAILRRGGVEKTHNFAVERTRPARRSPWRWADRNVATGLGGGGRMRRACRPEPSDLVIVQKPNGAVSQGHASSVDRVAIVNLLELEAWVAGVLAEQPIRLPSGFLDLRWGSPIRRPKARRRARFSQLVGIEFRRSARDPVAPSLGGKLAESILGGRELASPHFLVPKLVQQPSGDTVLFLCRQL